jgi:hypothetical protein
MNDGESVLACLMLAAIAVNELLRSSKGSLVFFMCTVQQFEVITEFAVQTLWVVASNLQPAAMIRTITRESGNDYIKKWNTARSCQMSYW